MQFETATLVAPLTYELSGLLRGQAGTERAMIGAVATGARFVLVDRALARLDLSAAQIGLPLNWRFGPADRDLGEESFASITHSFRGLGLRPFSPVHVRGSRSSGDLSLSWKRRTRMGGDSWDGTEVPLGEDDESYEIDILAGATVKRTLTTSATAATYTAAQQTADFGAPQATLSVRVVQVGAIWGRGTPAEVTI